MHRSTTPSKRKFRIGYSIASFVLLFIFAIPWWWQFFPELGSRVFLGAPMWFVTSAFGSLLVSIVTARSLAVAWDQMDGDSDE